VLTDCERLDAGVIARQRRTPTGFGAVTTCQQETAAERQ
jgi:hypothetical protein